jgi:hypothetical protein
MPRSDAEPAANLGRPSKDSLSSPACVLREFETRLPLSRPPTLALLEVGVQARPGRMALILSSLTCAPALTGNAATLGRDVLLGRISKVTRHLLADRRAGSNSHVDVHRVSALTEGRLPVSLLRG